MLVPTTQLTVSETSSNITVADFNENLLNVARQIDQLVTEQHAANILALWRIGSLVHEIDNNPEKYLKPEQLSQHVIPSMLLCKATNGAFRLDQCDTARRLFETYSTPAAIEELVQKRCPDKPGWRITSSHVQLLIGVSDPDQRKALENLCAREAYTTKALSLEVNEMRGAGGPRDRSPTAPKGLKQRVYDLVDHQKKFIARSEKLWLSENGLYDAIANTPPEKITDTIRGYVTEALENFSKMHELIQTHQAICQRVSELIEQSENSAYTDANIVIDAPTVEVSDKVGIVTR